MSTSTSRSNRRPSVRPPASGRPPSSAWKPEDVDASAEELMAFHDLFQDCFSRREQRHWSLFYLCGQLSNIARKTIEPMVLALHGADPNAVRAAQRFITDSPWDPTRLQAHQHALIVQDLGEVDAVVIAEGSGFRPCPTPQCGVGGPPGAKQGASSVGVARQYCGHLGKVANCQEGVFLVYVSSRGNAFLDERLYLPAGWFTEAYRARRKACRIPEAVHFQTEPQLALAMISDLVQRAVIPFRWVTADASYGKNLVFLEEIERLGKWALVEVPADTRVWLRTPPLEPPGRSLLGAPCTQPRVARTAPRPREVRELIARGSKLKWDRRMIKEGSQGPLVAEFAFLRVTAVRDGVPGPRVWLMFQRTLGSKPKIKFYFSNAPTTCPISEFVRVSGLRWPVETTLEEGKGEVGLDQNETRTWPSWHHHLSHAFLAQLFCPCPRPLAGVGRCVIHLRVHWPSRSALTTAQARLLIAQAIEEEAFPLRNVLTILQYRQRRNHAAYCSHRKRTLKRLRQLSKSRKRETS